jgi:hypothetical protein
MSPRAVWRGVAAAGTALVLAQQVVGSFPLQPRQGWGLLVLLLAVPAVALTVAALMPRAAGRLYRHPDLLVPLGVLVLADGLLGWLLLLLPPASVLTRAAAVKVLGIGLSLSASFVLSVLLHVAYATWMTALILDVVRLDRADPARALGALRAWFLRVLALEFFGWAGLFAGVAVAIALGPVALALAVVVIGAWSLAWNLATAALLPAALDGRLSFGQALARGVRLSLAGAGRWWPAVVAQLLLLGLVTFIAVSYTESRPGGYTTQSRTNWGVNGFWTGGYESGCRWYDKLMEALDAPKLAPVSTALGLVFGVLAIAVKLHIADRLPAPAAAGPGAPPGPLPAGEASYRPAEDLGREGRGSVSDPADDSFPGRGEA